MRRGRNWPPAPRQVAIARCAYPSSSRHPGHTPAGSRHPDPVCAMKADSGPAGRHLTNCLHATDHVCARRPPHARPTAQRSITHSPPTTPCATDHKNLRRPPHSREYRGRSRNTRSVAHLVVGRGGTGQHTGGQTRNTRSVAHGVVRGQRRRQAREKRQPGEEVQTEEEGGVRGLNWPGTVSAEPRSSSTMPPTLLLQAESPTATKVLPRHEDA